MNGVGHRVVGDLSPITILSLDIHQAVFLPDYLVPGRHCYRSLSNIELYMRVMSNRTHALCVMKITDFCRGVAVPNIEADGAVRFFRQQCTTAELLALRLQ